MSDEWGVGSGVVVVVVVIVVIVVVVVVVAVVVIVMVADTMVFHINPQPSQPFQPFFTSPNQLLRKA